MTGYGSAPRQVGRGSSRPEPVVRRLGYERQLFAGSCSSASRESVGQQRALVSVINAEPRLGGLSLRRRRCRGVWAEPHSVRRASLGTAPTCCRETDVRSLRRSYTLKTSGTRRRWRSTARRRVDRQSRPHRQAASRYAQPRATAKLRVRSADAQALRQVRPKLPPISCWIRLRIVLHGSPSLLRFAADKPSPVSRIRAISACGNPILIFAPAGIGRLLKPIPATKERRSTSIIFRSKMN